MKKAKVKNGIIQHVWPWVKTFPDGTQVVKELPPQYQGLNGKPVPDCIIDVPDDVRPNFIWSEKDQKYIKREKVLRPASKPHSDLIQVISKKLGISYEELWNEIIDAKKARLQASKKT
jgi:hypothetical protein